MGDWWEVLGVERNAELRAIKRAYAVKLKSIRQDEDPDGFMELRAAYDQARAHIQYQEQMAERQTDTEVPINAGQLENHVDNKVDDGRETPTSDGQDSDEHLSATPLQAPTIVQQLVDEVLSLLNSPWGAGNVASWRQLLDDERLDDIDVFADFENAFLNLLLNMHGFFDEEVDIESKLDLASAMVVFKRFGWNENRNSIYANKAVFDWMADKFFGKYEGMAYGDLVNLGIDPDELEDIYTQHEPNPEHVMPPPTGGFGNWFDNGGKYVVFTVIAVIFLFNLGNNQNTYRVQNTPALEEVRALLNGEKKTTWDCDELEDFAKHFGALPPKKPGDGIPPVQDDDTRQFIEQLGDFSLGRDKTEDSRKQEIDGTDGIKPPPSLSEMAGVVNDETEYTLQGMPRRGDRVRASLRKDLADCRNAELNKIIIENEKTKLGEHPRKWGQADEDGGKEE